MKGKITMTICVGCIALILTMVIFTQFKTVDETDITAIETMRETELRSELASWKAKYEEIEEKINEVDGKINEYKEEDNSKSFALVISNITDYNIEITARAYVVINEEVVYLNSKTYSVNSMVNEYLAQSSELGLTLDQVQALDGFNKFINEN